MSHDLAGMMQMAQMEQAGRAMARFQLAQGFMALILSDWLRRVKDDPAIARKCGAHAAVQAVAMADLLLAELDKPPARKPTPSPLPPAA